MRYTTRSPYSRPSAIVSGADEAPWFELPNGIGRIEFPAGRDVDPRPGSGR